MKKTMIFLVSMTLAMLMLPSCAPKTSEEMAKKALSSIWNELQDSKEFPYGSATVAKGDSTFHFSEYTNDLPSFNRNRILVRLTVKDTFAQEFWAELVHADWKVEEDGEKGDDSCLNLRSLNSEEEKLAWDAYRAFRKR